MLGRGKPDKDEDERKNGSFGGYLRGHIKTSNKTINIRGLFRVPDVSGGERLMINAEEREEEEEKNIIPQREQKEQVPIRDIDETNLDNNQTLPLQDEPLIPHSRVINYHPFRRPTVSSVHVEPSETDYQTIGTTKYKHMQQKPKQMLHQQK